ncbi:MAG TPA: PEGA domain-containing protein [Tepidisphaeraceae bacterium]|jgi:hypothetical protein|nr:PEGA domain-containing protein [Tepidisphaeraceae bacterium]
MLRMKFIAAIVVLSTGSVGCVQRTLTVRTDPPGALVYLNDQEIGRTPVTRNFTWYGYYDVEIRKPGYTSIKTTAQIVPPWWQIVPIDLGAEFFRLEDHHDWMFALTPPTEKQVEPDLLVRRGEELRSELRSSHRPATLPTTKPHHAKKQKA